MVNSRNKSFIKIKALLFIAFVLFFAFVLSINLIFSSYKNTIIKTLNNNFFKPVEINNIFYLPPNFIVLKGFSINETQPGKKIFEAPVSIARFSLPEFFQNKNIRILSFTCLEPVIEQDNFLIFLKDTFGPIIKLITGLPKQDFELSVRQLNVKTSGNRSFNSKADFNLKVSGKKIWAIARAGKDNLRLNAIIMPDRLIVENFYLNYPGINCQLQGWLNSGLAEFKGFILMNNLYLGGKSTPAEILILDLDSRIKFNLPRIEIERLNFSINNNPVKLTATMLTQPFNCNFEFASNFRSMDNGKNAPLKNIALTAKLAAQETDTFNLDACLNIDFLEHEKGSLPLKRIELNLKNLRLNWNKPSLLKINAEKLNLSSKTSSNSYNIDLAGFAAEIYKLDKPIKLIKFSSPFYGGRLTGNGRIETNTFMPVVRAAAEIKGANANRMKEVLIYFSKTYGKLSSQMYLTNYPQLMLKGKMHIKNGYLNNFEFLKWLANLFAMPELKKIDFDTASANFTADKKGAGMYNMDLDSKDVKIKGYFKLKESDSVYSKMFLSFRRKLLQRSPKFRPLLKLLDAKQSQVNFNFQLSGNLNGMNFKWLESDFKDEIQKAIPGFAKKSFEKKVSEAIESIRE